MAARKTANKPRPVEDRFWPKVDQRDQRTPTSVHEVGEDAERASMLASATTTALARKGETVVPVRVVLSSLDEEELVCGPFNQGVVIEQRGFMTTPAIIDVATGDEIARCLLEGIQRAGTTSIYARAFIQSCK